MVDFKEDDRSRLGIIIYKRDAWTSPAYESIGEQTNLRPPGKYRTVVCRYYTNPWWGTDQKEKRASIERFQNRKPYNPGA